MEHLSRCRMRRDAELIAMAEREDLGPRAGLPDKRIVGRRGAVITQTDHLAVRSVEFARVVAALLAAGGAADGHVDRAVRRKRHSRSAGQRRVADVQLLYVRKR